MSIFDNENDLPGVITEVEADYTFGYDTSLFGTTDGVIIIGTAFDGPVGELTPVYSPEHAAYVFGAVYDNEKKQKATLVAGIQDAWNRGCRTIYAMRVSGKEIYKDFNLCVDNGFKLRVKSRYPSNKGKQVYVYYDGTRGAEAITFYKPISRATIAEKKAGRVSSVTGGMLSTTINLSEDRGISYDSNLVDMISVFNSNDNNNVIQLSIVNENGVDVTNTIEAQSIPLGALYPGIYFIGRDRNSDDFTKKTQLEFHLAADGVTTPYSNFEEAYFRTLKVNTDVTQPLPIYSDSMKDLRAELLKVSVTLSKSYNDFLSVANVADRAWIPDNVDYEEADINDFELYKKLGDGYAITAHAEKRVDADGNEKVPRIRETRPSDTTHRIVPIKDGIYSVLQDASVKNRVLTCAYADQKISGKLPRANDFKIATSNDVLTLNETISIQPKVDSKDIRAGIKYSIEFRDMEAPDAGSIDVMDFSKVDKSGIYPVVGVVKDKDAIDVANYDNGTLLLKEDGTELYSITSGNIMVFSGAGLEGRKFIQVAEDGTHTLVEFANGGTAFAPATVEKDFVLGEIMGNVFAYQKGTPGLENIGELSNLLDENEDKVLVCAENIATGVENKIVIRSNEFDTLTLSELVDILNQDKVFKKLFVAEMTEKGAQNKDIFIKEQDSMAAAGLGVVTPAFVDRSQAYDYDLYIPYRTTDNFARQLAQHCVYTELKNSPTHGYIGCMPDSDISIKSVSNKVSTLIDIDFDLYGKTDYGRDILDAHNRPYPIGKNLSIIYTQYPVTVQDNSYIYESTGAAGYAGMVSTLPLDQSSTMQPIDIDNIDYELTSYQLSKLTSKGIVTLHNSFTKGIVVTDGITMAPSDSVYRRLSCSRIVGAVEEIIRAASEPFIGKQNHPANRNALQTAINSKLNTIVGTLIESFKFKMNADTKLLRMNRIEISFKIVPIYEIREVNATIKLQDNLTE